MSAVALFATEGEAYGDSALADMALSWVDHDVQPRAIVDHTLSVLWANAAARAALARRTDLEQRAGRLQTTDPSRQIQLRDYVLRGSAAVTTWCFPRADGDGHLLFRCQRILWDEDAAYGLTFFGSGTEFAARYADLDAVFGLTPTEHRVLLDILDGNDADGVATLRGTSIETARTHIRRIYDKLGVRSREEMCRRAAPFRL